ncbi:GtrA family protein [Halocalculus aciditolerans]|uniref:Polysaccharide biosynthesis protein GtrA n=1 Tax=Halocalculus aciditolerans TaxID=1383812 RepID=A0A830FF53_9EURY|nr:GtrA family protein [Halocalculus aciditolerans]GGL68482.1 polysaccharide biosynthesis protein GtrA [Halocalculus aciditolerans]
MVQRLLRYLYDGTFSQQLRRFVLVGIFTAGVQMVVLWALIEAGGLDYLVGAVLAIEFTIVLSYVLNNAWTFRAVRHSGTYEYLRGLAKTNLVRGTAVPIQLAVLAALVELRGITYLPANAAAIVVSGFYRYALDTYWTWGRSL